MQPITVKIGPHPATLVPPGVARAYEVLSAQQRHLAAAGRVGDGYLLALQCAALGLCWPVGQTWPAPIPPRPLRLGDELVAWGEGVCEGLLAAGHDVELVSSAGAAALDLCLSRIPRKIEVDRAMGNSEAPAAGSSGASSVSAVSGVGTSVGGTG